MYELALAELARIRQQQSNGSEYLLRQPWIIDGVMPTFLGASNIPASNVWASLLGFVLFYSILAIIDLVLIVKYVRIGPEMTPTEPEPSALAPAGAR